MTEEKRAIIFLGIIFNILLLNQSVTSNVGTESGVSKYRINSRVYERTSYPNSSVTNQRFEIVRRRLDFYRFKRESYGKISDVRFYPFVGFFSTKKSSHFNFGTKRRILREPYYYRQQRRTIINHPSLPNHVQRRSLEIDFDNHWHIMDSEGYRKIGRNTFILPKNRFLNSELTLARSALHSHNRRMNSRVRNTRNFEFLLYESRESVSQFHTSKQRTLRTIHGKSDQNSNMALVENSDTLNPAHSFFKSTLFHYFPDSLAINLNDFVISTVTAVFLYDLIRAMTESNDATMKKGSIGNFIEKMVSVLRKVTVH